MLYAVTGDDKTGWLLVFYTKDPAGHRVVFEVSQRRYSHESGADLIARARLEELQAAAERIHGRFPV